MSKSRQWTKVSSLLDLLEPQQQVPRSQVSSGNSPSSRPTLTIRDNSRVPHSPCPKRLARIIPGYLREGEHATNHLPTIKAEDLLEQERRVLPQATQYTDAQYTLDTSVEDSPVSLSLTASPWQSFSSRFPRVAASMRSEFPFWEPHSSSLLQVYAQFQLWLEYHPVREGNYGWVEWKEWYAKVEKYIKANEKRLVQV